MTELGSAAVPPVGEDDHLRGEGAELILYADLACPHCAAAWLKLTELPVRLCFRHFPMASKHARGPALHAAVEAAGQQHEDAFWSMVDRIYGNPGRQDDPHLWGWARELDLELSRFDDGRRSDPVANRVKRDFRSGIRAGVTGTPAVFIDGLLVHQDPVAALKATANSPNVRTDRA